MTIDTVVIVLHFWDLPLARACIASIRYWHPDVDIYLLKDEQKYSFSTKELEQYFGARVLPVSGKYLGYGTTRFEALFSPLSRYLVVDADTLFVGPVLDDLAAYDDDFLVTGVWTGPGELHEPEWLLTRDYIDVAAMQALDPDYRAPSYGVNGGQMVITNGKITEEMLDALLEFPGATTRKEYAQVLRFADQGIFNYLLAKLAASGAATVRYLPFWLWPAMPRAQEITVEQMRTRSGPPLILHWAGLKGFDYTKLMRYELIRFFEDQYYAQIPGGSRLQARRAAFDAVTCRLRAAKQALRRVARAAVPGVLRFALFLAVAAIVAACANEPLQVETIQLGKGVSPDHRVSYHATAFKPTDSVYASVITANTGTSTIEARWYYGSTKVSEMKKDVSFHGEGATDFPFRSSSGLPPGPYRVEILVDGKPAGERAFRVDAQ